MRRRRLARQYALQMLFQTDLVPGDVDEVFGQFWESRRVAPDVRAYAERLVRGVMEHREALDHALQASAEHWRVERMPAVDRNVLRIALYEMLYEDEVPPPVAIDEAIEVAKRFGGEASGAFVNGVLDDLRRRMERGEVARRA